MRASMRQRRRTKEACNQRGSGQFHRVQAQSQTPRESERGQFYKRNLWPRGALERAPRHWCRPPATEFGGKTSFSLSNAARRGLVDDRPEGAELFDGIDKFVKVNGFHHIGVHAELVAPHDVFLLMG